VWLTSSSLEQILGNTSGEGLSTQPVTFNQTPTTTQPEKNKGQTWSRASTQSSISAKVVVGRLIEGGFYQSWRMEPVLIV